MKRRIWIYLEPRDTGREGTMHEVVHVDVESVKGERTTTFARRAAKALLKKIDVTEGLTWYLEAGLAEAEKKERVAENRRRVAEHNMETRKGRAACPRCGGPRKECWSDRDGKPYCTETEEFATSAETLKESHP